MPHDRTAQQSLLKTLPRPEPEVQRRSENAVPMVPSPVASAIASTVAPAASPIKPPRALLFHQLFSRLEQERRPGLHLFTGAGRTSTLALPWAAFFAAHGETVAVVEAANNFNLYRLSEWALGHQREPLELLNRLRIARSFTPFQLAVILEHIGREMLRYRASRLVVTGLPDCLYDEELSEVEARNTFARCRRSLQRSAAQSTVLVFAESPPHAVGLRARFQQALLSLAQTAFEVHPGEPVWFAPLKAPGLLLVEATSPPES